MLGKADWLAHGLPAEGEQASVPRAKDLLRQDVATARLDERVSAIRQRVARSSYGFALVLAGDGALLGRLRKAVLEGNPDAAAQAVMEPGPATVRPDRQLADLLEPMRTHNLQAMVVTTPEGRLLGMLRRDDAERRLAEPVAPDR